MRNIKDNIGGEFAPDTELENVVYSFNYKRFVGSIYRGGFLLIKIYFLPKYVTKNITSLLNQAYSDGLYESRKEDED